MDLAHLIKELKARLEKVDAAIAALRMIEKEPLPSGPPRRRGRKGMGIEERRQVAQRMRKYWESKRQNDEGQ